MIVLANLLVQWKVVRFDLTQDQRHTISPASKQLVSELKEEVSATVFLSGSFNSGFTRLSAATRQLLSELAMYGKLRYKFVNPNDLEAKELEALQKNLLSYGLHPTAVYENNRQGVSSETIIYPFVHLQYADREQWISLLQNQKGLSGAENINNSIESLEYNLTSHLHSLTSDERKKIVFLEGQGELPEINTQDVQTALAEYFDIYRGAITAEAECLTPFSAVIIADPQQAFSEADKYVIDQYLMNGGRILWAVNGVQLSTQVLTDEGFTPAIGLDLNLTDMLFRYGIRINQRLVCDIQCLPIPVDVSRNPDQPQYQPMPWQYAPLLQPNSQSPITTNLSPVSATFCSDLTPVGEESNIEYQVLLSSSDATRVVPGLGEVDLSDLSIDRRMFDLSHLPVAMSMEGKFESVFAHRLTPEGINTTKQKLSLSEKTRQIVIGAGMLISNELQNGKPLPAGSDRYSRTQFSNRDFIVNSVLWLTDDKGILQLRQKTIPLRLLNANTMQNGITMVLLSALGLPLLLLMLTAIAVIYIRKRRYAK